jgi:hypothetical protein
VSGKPGMSVFPPTPPHPKGLARFEELVRKLTDIVTHRVEANLEAIRNTLLVDLPADRWGGAGPSRPPNPFTPKQPFAIKGFKMGFHFSLPYYCASQVLHLRGVQCLPAAPPKEGS